MFKNKIIKNAGWIIIFRIAQAFLNLFVGMMTARFLGPSNYGLINYAGSVAAFFIPIMRLGIHSVLVHELTSDEESAGEILGTAMTMNVVASVGCIIRIFVLTSLANRGESVTITVCVLYSLTILFQAFESSRYWFQAKLMSKYSSLAAFVSYFISAVYKIYILVVQKGICWFAVVTVIEHMLTAVILILLLKRFSGIRFSFSKNTAARLFSRGKYFIVASMMVALLQQTDKFMLKNILDAAATGYYSAAVTCAGIFGFVYAAVIDSANPVILGYKSKNLEEEYREAVVKLYSVIFYMSVAQCIFTALFSGQIIRILYGTQYMPAANALRICVWYVTYAYFGTIRHIWILAEGKHRHVLVIDTFTVSVNIVLNLLLIPRYGIEGAAAASFISQFASSFVLGRVYPPLRENYRLMVKGISPVYFANTIRKLIRR